MELQDFKIFAAVAESGSFLAASRALNYAQSSISIRMQQLEDELGTSLFYRTNRGIQLTPKGELFLRQTHDILQRTADAIASMREEQEPSGKLVVGSVQTFSETFLPRLLAAYHRAFPAVKLQVKTLPTKRLTEAVLAREMDFAVVPGEPEDAHFSKWKLWTEGTGIALPAEAADIVRLEDLARLEDKTLLAFAYGCNYRRLLEDIFRAQGIVPDDIIEFSSLGAIIAAVSAGMGLSLMPQSFLSRYAQAGAVHMLEVPKERGAINTYLICRSDTAQSKAMEAFLQMTLEQVREEGRDQEE